MEKLEIIYADTKDLTPYVGNSRTHSEDQVSQIAASIKEFGFTNPILASEDGTVIAGHGRLQAAGKLGMDRVPVIYLDGLSEAQQKALVLADNKLALNAGWDNEQIGIELGLLDDLGFDLSLTGFGDDDIANFMHQDAVGLTDEDAVPETPENPVTVEGDLWILGDHRLICGDSTAPETYDRLVGSLNIDLIHTDPPYGMNAVSKSGVLSARYSGDIIGDSDASTAKDAFILAQQLYGGAKQIWWGANYYSSVLPDSECWLVWDKDNGQSDQTDCELAWSNFRSVVRQFTKASEKVGRVHPTQKPVALMEWIITRFKLSSGRILDMFGGSGSTLIAAEKHGIKAHIVELDPAYCDVIIKRWQDFTGLDAIHEDGSLFNDLAKKDNREAA